MPHSPQGQADRVQGGFTLIELLVVVTVIAILAAMVLPTVNFVREVARRTKCRHNLSHCVKASTTYAADYRDNLPWFVIGSATYNGESSILSYFMRHGTPCGFGLLYEDGYDYNPFYCPSMKAQVFAKETWEMPYDLPVYNPRCYHPGPVAGYLPMAKRPEYWDLDFRGNLDRQIWTLENLPNNASVYVDVLHRQQYLPHGLAGVNVAFLDGAVTWYPLSTLAGRLSKYIFIYNVQGGPLTKAKEYWAIGDYFESHR